MFAYVIRMFAYIIRDFSSNVGIQLVRRVNAIVVGPDDTNGSLDYFALIDISKAGVAAGTHGALTDSVSIRKNGTRGGIRTHMRKNPRRILSPQRLPFRHPGTGRPT